MKHIHTFILISIIFSDACGVKRRSDSSRLASENSTCEISSKEIQERCDSPSIEARASGEVDRHVYGNVKDIQINKDGAFHARIEMGLVIGYSGAAPGPGHGLTRDTYDYFGGPESGRLPSARPAARETREPFNGGINELKAQNQKDLKSIDAHLASDTQRFELGRTGFADVASAAIATHNAAAATIDVDGLNDSTANDWPYQTPRDTDAGRLLEQARSYRDHVAQEVAKDTSSNRQSRQDLVGMADTAFELADDQYYGKSQSAGDFYVDMGLGVLDIALSFAPVVGNAYDAVQVLTGRSIAGELSDVERGIIAATLFIPMAKPGIVPKVLRLLERIGNHQPVARLIARLLGHSEPIVEAAAKYGVPTRFLAPFSKIVNAMATHPKGFKIERIRMSSNPNVIAVIGRGMDDVVMPTAGHLEKSLGKIETFQSSNAAVEEFQQMVRDLRASTGDNSAMLSIEQVKTSLMFKENKQWIERLKKEGATVIDMGDAAGISAREGSSVFHDMEKTVIFGD